MQSVLDLAFLRSHAALRRIALLALIAAAVAAIYALFAPRWYRSAVTLVPAKQQRSGGLSSVLGAELGGLAAGLDTSLVASADVARIGAVLESVAVSDAVISKFDLRARYRARTPEGARDELWRRCDVTPLPKPSLVRLSCEDEDPRVVQQILTYFAEFGNEVFRRVSVSSATEECRFLEQRVAELRRRADDASDRMREFQEEHQIVDLDTQSKALVSAIAALSAQKLNKQLELDFTRTFSSGDESTLQRLEAEVVLMERKLREFQRPSGPSSQAQSRTHGRAGLFPPADEVPRLRAELEGLYRDRKVAEASLLFSLDRLEDAKANEARNVSTFVVLDPPAMPTRPVRPRPGLLIVAAALFGMGAGIALEWYRAVSARLSAERSLTGAPPGPTAG